MSHFYKNQKNQSKNTPFFGSNEAQIEPKKEQGRSMVEMLGVLAVVGVLSIRAISGYRYAMNKYRANQVTNELNLLSHQVAMAMMGKNRMSGTLTLGEPYDTNKKLTSAGYEFAFGCGESSDTTECGGQNVFHMTINKVSEGVCKELLTNGVHLQYVDSVNVNDGDGCQSENANKVAFIFKAGDFMSEERVSSEDTEYCGGHGKYDVKSNYCICEEGYSGLSCQIDSTCSSKGRWIAEVSEPYKEGYCECDAGYSGKSCQIKTCRGTLGASYFVDCDCPEGADGPNCECQSGQKWDGTHCISDEAQECDNETSCPTGQYCYKQRGNSCTDEFGSEKGVCRSVEADSYKFGKYVASKVSMNWWSAKRFCAALSPSKSLVPLSDFSCKPVVSNKGYCHKDGPDDSVNIGLSKDLSDWPTELLAIRNGMYTAQGRQALWIGTEYGSSGSCGAYLVTLGNGHVSDGGKSSDFLVVCQ